jgi:hypothetical protein
VTVVRWGRRAAFLVTFGALYIGVGTNFLITEQSRFAAIPAFGVILDSRWWGLLWLAGGLVALGTAGIGRRDGPGFAGLLVPAGLWVIFYAATVIFRFGALGGLLVYVLTVVTILIVAGWPDAPLTRRR